MGSRKLAGDVAPPDQGEFAIGGGVVTDQGFKGDCVSFLEDGPVRGGDQAHRGWTVEDEDRLVALASEKKEAEEQGVGRAEGHAFPER